MPKTVAKKTKNMTSFPCSVRPEKFHPYSRPSSLQELLSELIRYRYKYKHNYKSPEPAGDSVNQLFEAAAKALAGQAVHKEVEGAGNQ